MPAATHSAAGTFSRYGACGRSIPTRASALPGVDGRTAASFPTAGGGGGEDPTCAPKETPSSDVPPVSTPEPSVVGVASSSCRTGLRRACARIAANAGTHGHLPVLWTSCPGPCGWQLAQRHSRMSRSVQYRVSPHSSHQAAAGNPLPWVGTCAGRAIAGSRGGAGKTWMAGRGEEAAAGCVSDAP